MTEGDASPRGDASSADFVRVWDPLQRLLHWALAATVVAGGITSQWGTRWHEAWGLAALGCVALRLAWGCWGPPEARFANFVVGPRRVIAHAREAFARREPRHLGHNPLGAAMTVALLAVVATVCITGWLFTTDRFWGDPLVSWLHEAAAWLLCALVPLHLLGVAAASLRHRENLVAAMITGRKRAADPHDRA